MEAHPVTCDEKGEGTVVFQGSHGTDSLDCGSRGSPLAIGVLRNELHSGLENAEIQAAATAAPTPYADETIAAARQACRAVAIVSNKSGQEASLAAPRQEAWDDEAPRHAPQLRSPASSGWAGRDGAHRTRAIYAYTSGRISLALLRKVW
jgi:hypothetical protein